MSGQDFDQVIEEEKWEDVPRELVDIEAFAMALRDAYPSAIWSEKLISDNAEHGQPRAEGIVGTATRRQFIAELEMLVYLGHAERKSIDGYIYYRHSPDSSDSEDEA
jgi:hypothetical protein